MRRNSYLGKRIALTGSIQDYLKAIYELSAAGTPASTSDLAGRLTVAPASVTGMLQKLATVQPALVLYQKHRGAALTRRGRLAALEVIRHHRLIETWLVKSLGYPWDAVHREAEVLEHVISEDFEKRIAEALGNPARDPHGEPIPTADLIMPEDRSTPLARLSPHREAIVCRVEANEPDFLRYLRSIGVSIGAKLKVLEVSRYDRVLRVQVTGRRKALTLGPAITSRVFVENVRARHATHRRAAP